MITDQRKKLIFKLPMPGSGGKAKNEPIDDYIDYDYSEIVIKLLKEQL
jgi:hypothetical protein